MKKKAKDLDIDLIGGQGSLTKDEELALSEYFRSKKLKQTARQLGKSRAKIISRKTVAA